MRSMARIRVVIDGLEFLRRTLVEGRVEFDADGHRIEIILSVAALRQARALAAALASKPPRDPPQAVEFLPLRRRRLR
jgi:hypothetical protein